MRQELKKRGKIAIDKISFPASKAIPLFFFYLVIQRRGRRNDRRTKGSDTVLQYLLPYECHGASDGVRGAAGEIHSITTCMECHRVITSRSSQLLWAGVIFEITRFEWLLDWLRPWARFTKQGTKSIDWLIDWSERRGIHVLFSSLLNRTINLDVKKSGGNDVRAVNFHIRGSPFVEK